MARASFGRSRPAEPGLSRPAGRDSRNHVPVYEYACKKCRKQFEYEQKMSDAPKKKCEACGGQLERLISMTSFQLKGSGWYKDLYSSSRPGNDSAASPSESSDSSADVVPPAKSEGGGDKVEAKKPAEPKADKPKKVDKPSKKKASSKGK